MEELWWAAGAIAGKEINCCVPDPRRIVGQIMDWLRNISLMGHCKALRRERHSWPLRFWMGLDIVIRFIITDHLTNSDNLDACQSLKMKSWDVTSIKKCKWSRSIPEWHQGSKSRERVKLENGGARKGTPSGFFSGTRFHTQTRSCRKVLVWENEMRCHSLENPWRLGHGHASKSERGRLPSRSNHRKNPKPESEQCFDWKEALKLEEMRLNPNKEM